MASGLLAMDSSTSSSCSTQYNLTGTVSDCVRIPEGGTQEEHLKTGSLKASGIHVGDLCSQLPHCPKRLHRRHEVGKLPSFKLVCQECTPWTCSLMTPSEGANWVRITGLSSPTVSAQTIHAVHAMCLTGCWQHTL